MSTEVPPPKPIKSIAAFTVWFNELEPLGVLLNETLSTVLPMGVSTLFLSRLFSQFGNEKVNRNMKTDGAK